MKLIEILGKDNLAGLREKLLGFKDYKPHLTEGPNYNTLKFWSNEIIEEDDFKKIEINAVSTIPMKFENLINTFIRVKKNCFFYLSKSVI